MAGMEERKKIRVLVNQGPLNYTTSFKNDRKSVFFLKEIVTILPSSISA
jgi:hypothetical protein